MATVRLGDLVQIQYLGVDCKGKATGPEHERKVLKFIAGSKRIIPGVSFGVVGMSEGEEKRMSLSAGDAYGEVSPKLIEEVPRDRFPAHINLYVGQRLSRKKPRSQQRRQVKVVEIRPDAVVVDGNHPLAGQALEVEMQLISLHSRRNGVG